MFVLEVCANSYSSASAAQEGGAHRIELCENMAEGGTTPSYGQIALCCRNLDIPIYPIIRPRGGNFVYSDAEFDIMKEDIRACATLGATGVVFGILTPEGEVDEARCAELIRLAHPLKVSFHRALDCTKDIEKSLETLISLGFERVLSSGGAATADVGSPVLKRLVEQASHRIVIMPGAGISEKNIAEIAQNTGAREFHGTFMALEETNSTDPIPATRKITSTTRIKEVISALHRLKK